MIAVFSFAAVSCIDEIGNTDIPTAETGDEVQFGLSLPDAKTRTVYGKEANNAFPIYWVNNDKVQIFSPQGLENRRSAEYQVSVTEANQNYADNLNKTGAYGVQWGEEYIITEDGEKKSNLHNFYSLYPSGNYTLSSDGSKAENITINYSQNIVVDGNSVKSDMEDCLMYAKAEGVVRGSTVNLKYSPISTVFMITLTVPENSVDDFLIQSISLIAPASTNIAGTFSLNIADGTFGGWASDSSDNVVASNTVTAQIADKNTGGLYTLVKGNSVQIPLFLAPITGLNTDGWKIEVKTNNRTYSKALGNQPIVAGTIHKVTLPSLSTTKVEEWNVADWMKNVPRNVYLSEVSIPGSWNSLNEDSQGSTPTIDAQYQLGVRAFHLDTRWKQTGSSGNYTYELGIAIGGASNTTSGDDKYMIDGDTFADAMDEVLDNVKSDEYMVVICSFAANSAQYNGADGWINAINEYCSGKDNVYDAKNLTANTLVGDVLNKVIVIVTTESSVSTIPKNSKCLFVNMPMTTTESDFNEVLDNRISDISKGTVSSTTASDAGIDIYHTHAQASIRNDQNPYSGNGDRDDKERGFIPTRAERKIEIENILNWSRQNYGNDQFKHDKWIYLGLGGYYVEYGWSWSSLNYGWNEISEPNTTVAADFNPLINEKVTAMGKNDVPYYPVGIVLMNAVGSYGDVVKNILLLNNKYQLQYDPTQPAFPTPKAKSAAASYSSGMQDTGTSAFGWE